MVADTLEEVSVISVLHHDAEESMGEGLPKALGVGLNEGLLVTDHVLVLDRG